MTPRLPGFGEFFRAVHGQAPAAWQTRLAERLAAARRWPDEVSVPDRVGKLGCIDIAVWWLALEAERPAVERKGPTRIWWVREGLGARSSASLGRTGGRDALHPGRASRRLGGQGAVGPKEGGLGCVAGHDGLPREKRSPRREGVSPSIRAERRVSLQPGDDCTAWARELAQVLADAALEPTSRAGPVGSVAQRLQSLCGDADGVPLAVVDAGVCDMSLDPARPAVILCSPGMYGSRLLFRGYGAEQPALDAAMAGTDSLVLVEGAGAAERLAGLVAALGECFPDALPLLPGSRQAATVVGLADDIPTGASDDVVRTPEVLAGLVWEWVKTTTPPEGEAPVEPYVSGIGDGGLGVPVAEKSLALEQGSGDVCARSAFALDRLDSLGKASAVRARRVAACLGLPSALCETVAFAAQLKDLGMADARFQRLLVDGHSTPGGSDDPEGWPSGGRQEALSARLVGAWLEKRLDWGKPVERDLLVHLVASHRGAARPLVVPVRDGTVGTVSARIAGVDVEVSADLAKTDWEQPARFRRLNSRFGPWRLALLEAIVTCSDGAAEDGKVRSLPP